MPQVPTDEPGDDAGEVELTDYGPLADGDDEDEDDAQEDERTGGAGTSGGGGAGGGRADLIERPLALNFTLDTTGAYAHAGSARTACVTDSVARAVARASTDSQRTNAHNGRGCGRRWG